MKELNKFRKFLAEGEAKGFTFIFKKGKTGENQIKKAKEILKDKKISFTSGGQMALDFSASQNQKDVKKALGDNGITRYIIGDIKEDLAEDRGEFEVPTNEARYGFFDNEEGNTGSSIVMEALNEYESVVERAFQNLINKTNTAINIGGSGGMDTEVRENLTYQFDKIQEKITTTDYINATFRK